MIHDERAMYDRKPQEVDATIAKLNAETTKVISDNRFHPRVVGSGATRAIISVAKRLH